MSPAEYNDWALDGLLAACRRVLRSLVREAAADPKFLQRLAAVLCEELGADPVVGQYLISKLKEKVNQ